jgi:protein-tyrosine-phosphatase
MKSNPVRAVLGWLRRGLVGLRDGVDGWLHPRRRRAAHARLAELAPSAVLFICLGNICRSPYAARVMGGLGSAVRADSSGYLGPGRAPPSEALEVARSRGIEHADHVSKLTTPEMLDSAQAVFVFDRFNVKNLRDSPGARPERVLWLGDFDPEWSGKRAIVDPWGKPLEEYRATFERIERCVAEVVRVLNRA